MEARTPSSFFEISINTDKFSQFTASLNAILASHEKQLQHHTRELSQIRLQTDQKVNRVRSECEYQFDRIQKKRKEEGQSMSSFHNDLTVKYEFLANEYRNRFTQFQEDISTMQLQIENQQAKTKNKIVKEIQIDIQNLMLNTKTMLDGQIENVSRKIKDMERATSSNDSLVRNIMNAYQNRGPQGEAAQVVERLQQNEIRYASNEKGLSLEQLTQKEGKERKRKKIQEKCEQENLQYASVSAKLELLENRLTAKENESLNKVVYASKKHSQCIPSQASEQVIVQSFSKIQAQRKGLEEKISFKLESIQAIIKENFDRLQKQLNKANNNQTLLRDQLDILGRKFDKEKSKIADLSLQMKRVEERRVDEKLIENMVTMFKRQYRSIQDQLQKKMSTDTFSRQKQRLGERIQVIGQSVAQKADKQEIKRAFMFVQDKIKEIVMIIADDVHNQKQGAGKRIPFKCLSCDKDLETSLPTTLRHNSDKKLIRPPTTHTHTSQIRKRVRVAHNQQRQ